MATFNLVPVVPVGIQVPEEVAADVAAMARVARVAVGPVVTEALGTAAAALEYLGRGPMECVVAAAVPAGVMLLVDPGAYTAEVPRVAGPAA